VCGDPDSTCSFEFETNYDIEEFPDQFGTVTYPITLTLSDASTIVS
jgi:hypothetical protein